ncbi:tubulin-tyrosine ligase-like protein, putative, partial [Bodo saltans]
MRKTSQVVASKSTHQRRPMESRVSPDRTPSPSPPASSSDIIAGGGGGRPRSPLDSPPPLARPQPRTSSSSQPAAAVSPATSSLSSQSPAVEGQGRRRESSSGASSSRQPRGTSPPAFSPDTQTINALNRATSPSTGGNSGAPSASYVVLGYSGAGQIFDLMKEQLLRNRSSCWSDGSPLLPAVLHGQLPAITGVVAAKQQQHSDRREPVTSRAAVPSSVPSSIGGTAPCCDRWSGISLYLGDKSSAERCLEESRYLAIRNRRKSSAAAIRRTGSASALGAGAAGQLCGHQKVMNDLRRRMMTGNHVGENDGKGAVALNSFTTTSTPPSSSNSQRSGGGLPAPLKQQTSGGQYGTTPQQGQQGPAIPYVPLPSSPVTLVNYIEGLKAITLKNRMVKTLRHYFRYSGWSELGQYLPITYQMIPDPKGPNGGSTTHDERVPLVQTMCQCNAEEFESSGEIATYWIAKSSHGAHGSNIRIFFADQKGLDQLVRFIDGQRDAFPWVVSRYIDRPLLYNNRKFDIRCWVLVTPNFDIYLHDALVMRMSSETYDRKNITTDSAAGRLANIT